MNDIGMEQLPQRNPVRSVVNIGIGGAAGAAVGLGAQWGLRELGGHIPMQIFTELFHQGLQGMREAGMGGSFDGVRGLVNLAVQNKDMVVPLVTASLGGLAAVGGEIRDVLMTRAINAQRANIGQDTSLGLTGESNLNRLIREKKLAAKSNIVS